LIKNQDKLGYQMLPILEPEYKLSNVTFGEPMKLSKLPNYKLGDQVNRPYLSQLVYKKLIIYVLRLPHV
jgi:hypothetical protein